MTVFNTQTAQDRVTSFAATTGTTPPAQLIDADGSVSDDLLTYCQAQDLSLDWVFLGEGQSTRPRPASLSDLEYEASDLHGVLQGLDQLIYEMPLERPSPITNAVAAISREAVAKAERLMHGLAIAEKKARQRFEGKGDVSRLFADWSAANERWRKALATLQASQSDTPETEALSEKVEAIAQALAAAKPRSVAECGLLIDWVLQDGEGSVIDPTHATVQRNVVAFLKGGKSA